MKQIIQSYASGKLTVADVPVPALREGCVLVQTVNSAVSVGTERLTMELARQSLAGKALARPDLVRRVINKARTDGVIETIQQATNRLDADVGLGYSCAGQVIQVGGGVVDFKVGDRVACAGQGHAQVVCVPKNLCVHIPDTVDYESACFVTLGAIALHGVRVAQPMLGENVAVIGLGLIGQLTVQILKAAGCHVFGIDLLAERVALAKEHGADAGAALGQDDARAQIRQFTNGVGADAVLILASTSSNEPMMLASEIARDRGRIVAVGMVKLDVPRNVFYQKELSVIVSRSSGPGIYDPQYEQAGIDYPISYVRWTMQRNMSEFLALLEQGKVRLDSVITHRFPIERGAEAYDMLSGHSNESYLGIVLNYDAHSPGAVRRRIVTLKPPSGNRSQSEIGIGLVGGGLFATTTLLPALKRISNIHLRGIAAATGISANHAGRKFGFDYCTSDYQQLLDDPKVDAVLIATRHNLHAPLTVAALKAGKHVFVEKPLALDLHGLDDIATTLDAVRQTPANSHLQIMVGFNRRYSLFSQQARGWLKEQRGPYIIHYRINAGLLPHDHWTVDPREGGGRILGEVCHFVDLIQYLTGGMSICVFADSLRASHEDVVITLHLNDGSVASVLYTAQGDRALPRERIEVFANQSVCVLDNFRSLQLIRNGRTIRKGSLNADKGHRRELAAFVESIRSGAPDVDFHEYAHTTTATLAIEESLRTGNPVDVAVHANLTA